jgi:hypothetical protein
MANTWVTDLTHFIDESGGLHRALTGPGLRLAKHMTSIVAAATSEGSEGVQVQCRRRSDRRRCAGSLEYRLWADERITWSCPECGDNGVISNWQSTAWDRRASRPVH